MTVACAVCSAALCLVGFVSQHSVQLLRIMSPPDRPTPSIHTLATRTHFTESVRAHARRDRASGVTSVAR